MTESLNNDKIICRNESSYSQDYTLMEETPVQRRALVT
nr:MAG TPA: hypothetical protein [Caudoviricetes sp.]